MYGRGMGRCTEDVMEGRGYWREVMWWGVLDGCNGPTVTAEMYDAGLIYTIHYGV